jgi:hypothetical protein
MAQPQTLKLEVSKMAVTRAQVKDEKKLPPAVDKADAKIDPKKDAPYGTKLTGDPKKDSPTKGRTATRSATKGSA